MKRQFKLLTNLACFLLNPTGQFGIYPINYAGCEKGVIYMVSPLNGGTVKFRFYRPDASYVSVAGDFNGWTPHAMAMERDNDGWWNYELRLAPGTYQFRYVADGQWYTDYAAFGLEHGPFGWNSVVKV